MDLDKLTKEALVSELGRRGEDTRGTKAVLKERLEEVLKEEAFQIDKPAAAAQPDERRKPEDDTRSLRTAASTTSSIASARALEKAKLAGLTARKEALKRRHLIEAEEAELRRRKEALEIQAEMDESEAKGKVLEEMLSEERQQAAAMWLQGATAAAVNPQEAALRQEAATAVRPRVAARTASRQDAAVKTTPKEVAPATTLQEASQAPLQEASPAPQQEASPAPLQEAAAAPFQQEVTEATTQRGAATATQGITDMQMAKRLHLPSLDFAIFRGDPAKFKPFIRTFESNIARYVDCEEEKLLYLLKFTRGKPHDLIQTCVHLPEGLGYAQAVKLLRRRYDDQAQTVASLVDEMLDLPVLRADDGDGLDDFGIFLRGCLNALETLPHGLGAVDSKTIRKLLEKFPYHMIERWRRKADKIEQEGRRPAGFGDFVDFIEMEARIATNPSYGRHVLGSSGKTRKDDMKKAETKKMEVKKVETQAPRRLNTGRALGGSVQPVEGAAWCLFCEGKHQLEACKKFENKKPEEKSKYVKEKGLCFACLQHGHRSRFCKERKTCEKCSGRHPTVLHEERSETPTATTGHLAPSKTGGAKLQVLRVQVGLGSKKVTTNAFLDSGSTYSFVASHLLDKMKMKPQRKMPLKVSTIKRQEVMDSSLVPGLVIESLDGDNGMELPPLYVLDHIPVEPEDVPSQEDIDFWTHLQDAGVHLQTTKEDQEIGLLIGANAAGVMEPVEVCPSQDGGPFALKTKYGWVLSGAAKSSKSVSVNRIRIVDEPGPEDLFEDRADTRRGLSVEDVRWCAQMETGCRRRGGKYQIKLPFRAGDKPLLDDNRQVALKRLDLLKKVFEKDPKYAEEYKAVMTDLLEKGYAEEAPDDVDPASRWYLPHFGVRHPQKEKVRVVFDCASKFNGVSLNDTLLQGPDLTNPLLDVLIRFREEQYAFTGDIEAMFMQVLVPEPQRDYLRFLWWPQGDTAKRPREYRNTRHLFGATSSPSCANLALHRTAEDFGQDKKEARDTVRRNFYVDDVLKSVRSEEAAVKLVAELKELCSEGGFNLTKISSNSVTVLKSIPREERAKQAKDLVLGTDALPVERALGVLWDTNSDLFSFQVDMVKLMKKPVTKRGMLSATASCYDPLGLVTPCIVRARILIQDLFRLKVGWDEAVPNSTREAWERWLRELPLLSNCRFPRCLSPGRPDGAVAELHHFSDASQRAYGTVSFLRTVTPEGDVHCALLTSRARLAPVKTLTIPRLELAAAKLAVEVGQELARALDTPVEQNFWTDSTTVLKYIRNKRTRFHVFVANRLAAIHDGSSVEQWRFVPTSQNPADLVSRGVDAQTLTDSSIWRFGPQFLKESPDKWPRDPEAGEGVSEQDPEVKAATTCLKVDMKDNPNSPISPMKELTGFYSTWKRLSRAVAWLRRVLRMLKEKAAGGGRSSPAQLSVQEIQDAERCILLWEQEASFPQELKDLRAGNEVRVSSSLARLDPVIQDGLLRAQGRLKNSALCQTAKRPVILPKKGRVVDLLIEDFHRRAGHEGRQHVMADISRLYWVLGANSAVRRVLSRCLSCRRRQRPPENQKMADLPEDRVQDGETPFTRTGVDFFGNFYVKRGRSRVKKYGVLFTCLATRAVHIEVADSMSTDSFICALRRFVSRRGDVRVLRSDRGTNFTGADRELRDEVRKLREKNDRIQRAALDMKIDWKFNPPHASHFGGAWERQIRTVRKILNALLTEQAFTDETLHTLLCEVECIMNNRPLTPVSADHRDELPLTPNHLLHLRCIHLPSSDTPGDGDLAGRRHWKQAAYLADQFWRRWRREYLPLLQERAGRCTRSTTNLKPGDIVLLVDDTVPRGTWPLGRVEAARRGSDGRVRSVHVRVRGTTYERPVNKVVKIVEQAAR